MILPLPTSPILSSDIFPFLSLVSPPWPSFCCMTPTLFLYPGFGRMPWSVLECSCRGFDKSNTFSTSSFNFSFSFSMLSFQLYLILALPPAQYLPISLHCFFFYVMVLIPTLLFLTCDLSHYNECSLWAEA